MRSTKRNSKLHRLCFVGSLLGGYAGHVPSQAELLARLFFADGYAVREVSTKLNRAMRLADLVLRLLAWRRRIDIAIIDVFSGQAFIMADVASRILSQAGVSIVFVLRGGELPSFTMRRPSWVERVLRRGHCLVAPSSYLRERVGNFGVPACTIHNVIPVEHYSFRLRSDVQPRLLWMRSFHDVYHPEMAARVLARLVKILPAAELTMAGQDRGGLGTVRELVEELDVARHVRFPGFLTSDDKKREFDAHDIFLNTNRIDNMPVSLLEAAAAGLPIVATEVGGIPYLVRNEETALLVADTDVDAMATAVKRLVGEPELAARLSSNGRRLALGCSWEVVRQHWQRVFDEVCEDDRRASAESAGRRDV